MWLCCQQPWRWLAFLMALPTSVWAVDENLNTLTLLGGDQPLALSEPRWVFVTPWVVLMYFTRVRSNDQRLAPRWWFCCGSWTDATAYARCRRLALLWREHRR
ncbi:hypothetical protein [Pseudidiomarina sp. CB1]|uniref:hypothetical protein n=1 Tax=Pseudidiomarina sp. CB1 TaxID=2972484 RepID=UPI002161E82D|nr:hypothetical protein [Pseudidiomarina sp. CB1]